MTITAVICWSINMRMVTSSAGSAAARYTHQGLLPKGGIIQPLWGLVGWSGKKGRRRRKEKKKKKKVKEKEKKKKKNVNLVFFFWINLKARTASQVLTLLFFLLV